MRLRSWSTILLTVSPVVWGDIEIVAPQAGAILKGGGPIAVEWEYPGNFSSFSGSAHYDVFLCAGGNSQDGYDQLAPVMRDGLLSDGNFALSNIDASVGGSHERAYFLKMICSDPDGPTEITYSKRFSLVDMTGTFPKRVQDTLKSISGTDGPGEPREKHLTKRQNPAMYTVPYAKQTGLTKYAPKAIQPPTKITMETPTPLYPTSAYKVATTFLPPATVRVTLTAPNTLDAANMENTAAPAPQPQQVEDMQKFLKRWMD